MASDPLSSRKTCVIINERIDRCLIQNWKKPFLVMRRVQSSDYRQLVAAINTTIFLVEFPVQNIITISLDGNPSTARTVCMLPWVAWYVPHVDVSQSDTPSNFAMLFQGCNRCRG